MMLARCVSTSAVEPYRAAWLRAIAHSVAQIVVLVTVAGSPYADVPCGRGVESVLAEGGSTGAGNGVMSVTPSSLPATDALAQATPLPALPEPIGREGTSGEGAAEGGALALETRRTLDQHAWRLEEAVRLLERAYSEGAIGDEDWDAARAEHRRLLDELFLILSLLDRCEAVARRLDRAVAMGGFPSEDVRSVIFLKGIVAACQERALAAEPAWDPGAYREAREEGTRLLMDALDMPRDAHDRSARLEQSLDQLRWAVDLLESALKSATSDREMLATSEDLLIVGARLALAMLELDLRFLAEVQLEDVLELTSDLPSETRRSVQEVAAMLEAQTMRRAESGLESAEPLTSDILDALRAQLGVGQPGEGDPPTPPDDLVGPESGEAPDPPDSAAPVRRVPIRIETVPSRVRVYVDGEYIGRTPLSTTFESIPPWITITLRKTDYETQRVEVDLTRHEGAVELRIELRPSGLLDRQPQDGPPYPEDFQPQR